MSETLESHFREDVFSVIFERQVLFSNMLPTMEKGEKNVSALETRVSIVVPLFYRFEFLIAFESRNVFSVW